MKNKYTILLTLLVILILTAFVSLSIGGSRITLSELCHTLFGVSSSTLSTIIWQIRLPRVILGIFTGMGLAAVGCVFQGLLRNPLADPYTLGISGGAAFGATLATITGIAAVSVLSLPLCAFLGSLACFYAVYFIASRKNFSVNSLILTGVIFGFIFSSAVLLMLAVASPDKIQSSLIWLTGDLSSPGTRLIFTVSAIVACGIAVLLVFSQELNILALGEEKALTLGVNTGRTKKVIFVTASLITGACVSASRIIGFVGLIIPHLMRKVTGPDHRFLLPASILAGGIFLPLCDCLARSIIAPTELPVGVITGLAGGIFVLFFLLKPGNSKAI
jgi:iron complex transport system permease protein